MNGDDLIRVRVVQELPLVPGAALQLDRFHGGLAVVNRVRGDDDVGCGDAFTRVRIAAAFDDVEIPVPAICLFGTEVAPAGTLRRAKFWGGHVHPFDQMVPVVGEVPTMTVTIDISQVRGRPI